MLLLQNCRRTPKHSKRASWWIIATSLGAVLITVGLQLAFGKSVYSQTLLYSAFPLALVGADHASRPTGDAPPLIRGLKLVVTLSAMYAFFLGVTMLANWI